jgi:hypothetical protein
MNKRLSEQKAVDFLNFASLRKIFVKRFREFTQIELYFVYTKLQSFFSSFTFLEFA